MRARRCGRAIGHRPRQAAVRRRLCQRPAALRQPGQRGGLSGPAASRRHRARHEPGPWRSPDPRRQGEFFRQALQRRAVRHRHHHGPDRLRRSRAPGGRAQAEDDHRRVLGLFEDPGLPALPSDRGQGRRVLFRRHGPRRRPGGDRSVPQSPALRRRGHHHHPQDPARPPWRSDSGQSQSGTGEEAQRRGVPRWSGWPADARDRRQGRVLQGSAGAGIQDLSVAGDPQRPGHGAGVYRAWL
ncbi:hypothetical protein D3C78_1198160 [compost metagenome]